MLNLFSNSSSLWFTLGWWY